MSIRQRTRYIGSLVYDDGSFESASFGGGRIVGTNNGANSEVHYFLTDHLGSTRVVAKVTATGRQDIDRKDYYPFGKVWSNPDMPASDNRYTSGKEQQYLRYCAVDYADFGARFYDSNTGIFLQQDPLAEKVYRLTSYGYCNSNPINLVDPTGMETADEEAQRKAEQEANEWRKQGERNWREMMASAASVSAGAWNANVNMGERSDNTTSSQTNAAAELVEKIQNMTLEEWNKFIEEATSKTSTAGDIGIIVTDIAKLKLGSYYVTLSKVFNRLGYATTGLQAANMAAKVYTGQDISTKEWFGLGMGVVGIGSVVAAKYGGAAMAGAVIGSSDLALAVLYGDYVITLGNKLWEATKHSMSKFNDFVNDMPRQMYNPGY